MKKSIFIIIASIAVIGGVYSFTGSSDCCSKDKSCSKKATAKTEMNTQNFCCNPDGPCSCEDCTGACKEACEKAGHCVCADHDKQLQASSKVSKSDCSESCKSDQPCTCEGCDDACMAKCEAAGHCVCN